MNKAFKKYYKSRWTNTRLSRKQKVRLAFKQLRASSVIAQSIANIELIRSASGNKAYRAQAIISAVLHTYDSIGSIFNSKQKQLHCVDANEKG